MKNLQETLSRKPTLPAALRETFYRSVQFFGQGNIFFPYCVEHVGEKQAFAYINPATGGIAGNVPLGFVTFLNAPHRDIGGQIQKLAGFKPALAGVFFELIAHEQGVRVGLNILGRDKKTLSRLIKPIRDFLNGLAEESGEEFYSDEERQAYRPYVRDVYQKLRDLRAGESRLFSDYMPLDLLYDMDISHYLELSLPCYRKGLNEAADFKGEGDAAYYSAFGHNAHDLLELLFTKHEGLWHGSDAQHEEIFESFRLQAMTILKRVNAYNEALRLGRLEGEKPAFLLGQ